MKKCVLCLLVMLLAVAAIAASDNNGTYRAVGPMGDFRRMTVKANGTESVEEIKGVGGAYDMSFLGNSNKGTFLTLSYAYSFEKMRDGEATKKSWYQDSPLALDLGLIWRIPFSSAFGLDFRIGMGYALNGFTQYYEDRFDGYFHYIKLHLFFSHEIRAIAGIGGYYFFNKECTSGLRFGVNVTYTILTFQQHDSDTLTSVNHSIWKVSEYNGRCNDSDQIDAVKKYYKNYRRTGWGIKPYIAYVFAFSNSK